MRQAILNLLREDAYKPMPAEEIAQAIGVEDAKFPKFLRLLEEMESEGTIIRTRTLRYGVPERMDLVVGRLQGHSKGFGFVEPDQGGDDVFIPADDIHGAMHNDRVVARLRKSSGDGRRREGEIIRILQRANHRVVGNYESSRHYGFVTPDDARIAKDIYIPKGEAGGAKDGDKVVVEITQWPQERRNPEGRVVEIIGSRDAPGVEIQAIIKRHQLPDEFPAEVMKEAKKIPAAIDESEIAGRTDLREMMTVTIDSEDAKDLDDAVSIAKLPNGNYRLGVHIADVSYYVREGSHLDREAQNRGTSIYLVDRVIPMLPLRLSNGICSLNAGEDRLSMSVLMEFTPAGERVRYEITPSVIRVDQRLTYTIVKQILVNDDKDLKNRFRYLLADLYAMRELCLILRQKRMQRGSIDFDFPETKVKLDPAGRVIDILPIQRSIAEQIIEEFMLATNETIAEHVHWLNLPFVYRVHEEPDEAKIAALNEFLHNFGYHIKGVNKIHPKALQDVLRKVEGRPEELVINTVLLRSMKQACYSTENIGHFGLAAKFYCHFTSPIRRYPDLIIHRIIRDLQAGKMTPKRIAKLAKTLPGIAQHSSARERLAVEAERETVDLKKVEYMQDKVGEIYQAIISSVTNFGMFVTLPNSVEGLVHVSNMTDDYYHYHEKAYALIGERTGKTYRIGQEVTVQVLRVSPQERQVDFILASK